MLEIIFFEEPDTQGELLVQLHLEISDQLLALLNEMHECSPQCCKGSEYMNEKMAF